MTKILKEDVKLLPQKDGTFILDKHYRFSLNKKEVKEFKENLQAQIDTCEKEIEKITGDNLQKLLTEVENKLQQELDYKKAAVENFEKYKKDTINKFRKNAVKKYNELLAFCNPEVFQKYKEMVIEGMKKEKEKEVQNYEYQLKDIRNQVKAYEEY